MYARYIPPPRNPTASRQSLPSAAPLAASAEVPAKVAHDGYSYARYIPGSRKGQQHGDVVKGSPRSSHNGPVSPHLKRKSEALDEPPDGQEEGVGLKDNQFAKTSTSNPSSEKVKKKRRKRAKKQRTNAPDDSEESDENGSRVRILQEASEKSEVDENVTSLSGTQMRGNSQQNQETAAVTSAKPESAPPAGDGPITASSKPTPYLQNSPPPRPKKKKDRSLGKDSDRRTAANNSKEPGDALEQQSIDPRHKSVLERKEKSLRTAKTTVQEEGSQQEDNDSTVDEAADELHGLEPLPQPEAVPVDDSKPTYEALPPWLASPIRVPQATRANFTEVGILPKPARLLEERGFREAFAVQTAAIPLLLPSSSSLPGDLLVSAATGSGKTLAYALPIVQDISQGLVTRLRALIVLPTRELVKQAQEVFELCSSVYEGEDRKRVRIGIAIGSQSLTSEQKTLMRSESRYDPVAHQELLETANQHHEETSRADLDCHGNADALQAKAQLGSRDGEVIDFASRVDILICTPGRLVEHLAQTPGFNVDHVRWLVVDEADKLLAQSFQGWLELVLSKFRVSKFGARDFPNMDYSGVRKVVLSATLTRDPNLVRQLSLRRPQLVVLDDVGSEQMTEHALPASLVEYAVRVHNSSLKPLYLSHLLRSTLLHASNNSVDADSGSDDGAHPSVGSDADSSDSGHSSRDCKRLVPVRRSGLLPRTLIFTKSCQAALRLSRLLELLGPEMPKIGRLTSDMPTHIRRKTLRAFASSSSKLRVLVASDLVARGIDIPRLGHVINYDLPPTVAGYVHRVGRTARAGRKGCAWTLLGDDESGWFWGKIAKNKAIWRPQKVSRMTIDEDISPTDIAGFDNVLAQLHNESLELKRR